MGSKQSPSTRKVNLKNCTFSYNLKIFPFAIVVKTTRGLNLHEYTISAQTTWVNWRLTKNELEFNLFAAISAGKFSQETSKGSGATTENCIRKGWFEKESKASQSVMFYWPWNKLSVASNTLDRSSAVISTVLWLFFTTHWKLKFTEVEICAAASNRFLVMPTFNEILVWLVKKCRGIAIPVNDIISRGYQAAEGERQVHGNFNQGKSSVNRGKKWNWKSKTSFTCHGGASQRARGKNEAKLICVKLNFHFSLLSVFAFDCESGMFAKSWRRKRGSTSSELLIWIDACTYRAGRILPRPARRKHLTWAGKQTRKVQGALRVDVKTGLCGWFVQQGLAF